MHRGACRPQVTKCRRITPGQAVPQFLPTAQPQISRAPTPAAPPSTARGPLEIRPAIRCSLIRDSTVLPSAGREPGIPDGTTQPLPTRESATPDFIIPQSTEALSDTRLVAEDLAGAGLVEEDSVAADSTTTISSSAAASVVASDLVGDGAGAVGGTHGGGVRVGAGGVHLPFTATRTTPGTLISPSQYHRNMEVMRLTHSRQTPLHIQTRIKSTMAPARINSFRKARPIRIRRRSMSRCPLPPCSSI